MVSIDKEATTWLSLLDIKSDPKFTGYQIRYLSQEAAFLERQARKTGPKLHERNAIAAFLWLHVRQFYWTITRLCGLGYLHDGRRAPNTQFTPRRPRLAKEHIELSATPRVLIDVTVTYRNNAKTGIQRVVREVAKAAIKGGNALPIIVENGRFRSYFRHPDLPDVIEIQPGDRYLLLDAGWFLADEYLNALREVARCGGTNIACVYDIIPLLYSGLIGQDNAESFLNWYERSLYYYDAVVAISKSVAEDFGKFVLANNLPHKPLLRIGWFHLGADFSAEGGSPSQPVLDASGTMPFFLTVGTIEPRKNHLTALDAFERLWSSGVNARYIIVGKYGGSANALRNRIAQHPEFGYRLLWLEQCDDIDVQYLYRHAAAVIQPSIAEGFGLPIIEAAHFGTPVIASDIRVFHEIGGQFLAYFDPLDSEALADRIKEALGSPRAIRSIPILSWTEATNRLLTLIKEEAYEFALPDAS